MLRRSLKYSTMPYGKMMEHSHIKILGIETSCDDTGCAVVNGSGKILGEALHSQNKIHLRYGGVNPIIAQELHRDNIEVVVAEALEKACLTYDEIDVIGVTVKPGLLVSLQVGVKYAKFLSKKYGKPLIPIHHMEAHALMARMYYDIPFPFLVLLISGGDCLVAVAKDVDDFLLLGQTLDNAPGEVLDKVARRLKLRNLPEYFQLAGGKAIEMAARNAKNSGEFIFPIPLIRNRDCNFSFSGLKDSLIRKLLKKEADHGIIGDGVIPEVNDLCAAFQLVIAEHIIHRVKRAILFSENKNLIHNTRNIVVSGGVASNDFIFKALTVLGKNMDYQIFRPPSRMCTDNGVMIAWNAVEKVKKKFCVVENIDLNAIEPVATFGTNLINEVKSAYIPVQAIRLNSLIFYIIVFYSKCFILN